MRRLWNLSEDFEWCGLRILTQHAAPLETKYILCAVLNASASLEYTDLQVEGDISYNGRSFNDFIPLRTATYVEQNDTVCSSKSQTC